MPSWWLSSATYLWQNALAALPFLLLVAAVCRWLPCRAPTRHCLWFIALLWLVVPPLLPASRFGGNLAGSLSTTPAQPVTPTERTIAEAPSTAIRTVAPPGRHRTAEHDAVVHSNPIIRKPPQREPATTPPTYAHPAREPVSRRWAQRPEMPRRPRGDRSEPVVAIPSTTVAAPREIRLDPPAPSPLAMRTLTPRSIVIAVAPTTPDDTPAAVEVFVPDPEPSGASVERVRSALPGIWIPQFQVVRAYAAVCLEKLLEVRGMIMELPRPPLALWLGGVAMLVLVYALRTFRMIRLGRRALPAPRVIRSEVLAAARRLGLRRAPRTFMVSEPISPMILCGARPRLLLPHTLWSQLDRIGRHAVIYHELAHLKRRDHWVFWIAYFIGLLYWWNPLVWWARRNLHEEAELCCDQWVTWLLPCQRRAYAEALLKARQSVQAGSGSPLPLSIGATSPGAQKFARRIKMIMTENARPRLSLTGAILACGLAYTGWVTTPVWACDPKPQTAKAEKCPDAKEAAETAKGSELSTFEAYMAGRGLQASDPDRRQAPRPPKPPKAPKAPRAPRGEGRFGGEQAPPFAPPAFPAGNPDRGDGALRERIERLEQQMDRLSRQLQDLNRKGPMFQGFPTPPPGPEHEGETISRSYHLPEGKLKALTNLMIRSDVPVLVSPEEEHIEVHATEHQHDIFRAFIHMIDPEHNPDPGPWGAADSGPWNDRLAARLDQAREEALNNTSRGWAENLERQSRMLMDQARALELQSEQIEHNAESFEQQAEALEEAAEALEGAAQEDTLRQAAELTAQAAQLNEEAEALSEQAEQLEEQGEELIDAVEIYRERN